MVKRPELLCVPQAALDYITELEAELVGLTYRNAELEAENLALVALLEVAQEAYYSWARSDDELWERMTALGKAVERVYET